MTLCSSLGGCSGLTSRAGPPEQRLVSQVQLLAGQTWQGHTPHPPAPKSPSKGVGAAEFSMPMKDARNHFVSLWRQPACSSSPQRRLSGSSFDCKCTHTLPSLPKCCEVLPWLIPINCICHKEKSGIGKKRCAVLAILRTGLLAS